jgi:hypothetical protein
VRDHFLERPKALTDVSGVQVQANFQNHYANVVFGGYVEFVYRLVRNSLARPNQNPE